MVKLCKVRVHSRGILQESLAKFWVWWVLGSGVATAGAVAG